LPHSPLQCSFALFRRGEALTANSLDVAYLFHETSDDADAQHSTLSASAQASEARLARREHPGSMAYGCGRRGDALKLYLLWQRYGRHGLGAHVDAGFELAKRVSQLVREGPHANLLELGPQPDELFLQVCFRPKEPSHHAAAVDGQTRTCLLRTKATRHVYDTLRARRRFAVDFAPLPGDLGDFIR
jgi:glutamate decarboxylase